MDQDPPGCGGEQQQQQQQQHQKQQKQQPLHQRIGGYGGHRFEREMFPPQVSVQGDSGGGVPGLG